MTATDDPLARVQAMVNAWGETELFDTFDTPTCEVSPLNPLENCGFGHFRQFRHQELEHASTRDQSVHAYRQEAHEQESASRVVSYSSGVESVESVENDRKGREDSDLSFDTSSLFRCRKMGTRCRKRSAQRPWRRLLLQSPSPRACRPRGSGVSTDSPRYHALRASRRRGGRRS
jgi:hypothetical protein